MWTEMTGDAKGTVRRPPQSLPGLHGGGGEACLIQAHVLGGFC